MALSDRKQNELQHSAHIKDRAEDIWGWGSPAGKRRAARRAEYFISLSQMQAGDRVLEIGCGTGLFTERAALTRAAITATDLSEDLLTVAKKKNLPNCRFEAADAHHLSYESASFDIVFGSSVLHHLDLGKALQEIKRVLKTGGRMVFAEPNMLNPQIIAQKNIPWLKKRLGDSPDETAFFRWQIAKLLRNSGLRHVRVFPYDFLHPTTPAFLIAPIAALGRVFERLPLLKEIAGSLIIYAEK